MQINEKSNKYKKGDLVLSWVAFIQSPLLLLQLLFANSGIISDQGASNVRMIITALVILIGAFYIIKRRLKLLLGIYGIVIPIILLNSILFPNNIEYINNQGFRFLLPVVIPTILCISAIYNIQTIKDVLKSVSYLTLFLASFYVILLLIGVITLNFYSMSLSYALLLPTLYFIYLDKVKNFLMAFLLLLIILVLGSRGAIIFAILYYFVVELFSFKFLKIALLLSIMIAIWGSLPSIMSILEYYGFYSRTFDLLMSGDLISHDSGRGDIYRFFWNKVLESPIWGYGLFGDRFFLEGAYCHNIFIEFCVDFGLLIGCILFICLLFIILKTLFYWKGTENVKFILLFFFGGFLPLMISNSYLISYDFGIFIGILILFNRKDILYKCI